MKTVAAYSVSDNINFSPLSTLGVTYEIIDLVGNMLHLSPAYVNYKLAKSNGKRDCATNRAFY